MSSGKKLNISPLPEQSDSYSHYEESVIRWDRIIGAGLIVIVLVGALIAVFLSGDDDAQEAEIAAPKAMVEFEESAERVNVAVPNSNTETSEPARKEVSAEGLELTKLDTKVQQGDVAAKQADAQPVDAPTHKQVPAASHIEEKQTSLPAKQARRLASVSIKNAAITDAVLSLSIKNDVPGEAMNYSISADKGLLKVILYTEMSGLKGQVLYHEWYRNGEREARVKIPVNVSKQRSYSSKFIDKYMLGEWQVKVLDAEGQTYILADFEVNRS